MTYKDIKCIDESWLDNEIQYLNEHSQDKYWKIEYGLKILNLVKQHLTSATPILEKAFEAGYKSSKMNSYKSNGTFEQDFEQFLNTEVK